MLTKLNRPRSRALRSVAVLWLGLWSIHSHCQVEVVQYAKVFRAHRLAATILDYDEKPVANVHVQVCAPDWKNCGETATTNPNGEFSIPSLTAKRLYYLRLSAPGFNPLEVKIRTSRFGKDNLVLHMYVAT